MKLCQIIAIVKGLKQRTEKHLTSVYQICQKGDLFTGISRVYTPLDDEGTQLPEEGQRVQHRVDEMIDTVRVALTELYDTVATQDNANCSANADVKVAGVVIVRSVPVTHLLFLEKKLGDLATCIGKLPTVNPAVTWHEDRANDSYATMPSTTLKTKKTPRVLKLAAATEQHPEQVEVHHEDIAVGNWSTTNFSGGMLQADKSDMLARCVALRDGVIQAREEANSMEVSRVLEAKAIFDFVFNGDTEESAA